jgi:hypothetical protein
VGIFLLLPLPGDRGRSPGGQSGRAGARGSRRLQAPCAQGEASAEPVTARQMPNARPLAPGPRARPRGPRPPPGWRRTTAKPRRRPSVAPPPSAATRMPPACARRPVHRRPRQAPRARRRCTSRGELALFPNTRGGGGRQEAPRGGEPDHPAVRAWSAAVSVSAASSGATAAFPGETGRHPTCGHLAVDEHSAYCRGGGGRVRPRARLGAELLRRVQHGARAEDERFASMQSTVQTVGRWIRRIRYERGAGPCAIDSSTPWSGCW